jgi:hypothetical protein
VVGTPTAAGRQAGVMAGRVAVFGLEDRAAWERAAATEDLPSHTWNFAHGLAAMGVVPRLAVIETEGARLVVPHFERTWGEHRDVASLLGLSGVSLRGADAAPLRLWQAHARAQGWVAGYLQLDPLSTWPLGLVEAGLGHLVGNNAMFIADLSDPDPLAGASRTIARKVAAAERSGVTACLDPESLMARLVDLYPACADRFGNPVLYDFPEPTLRRWATAAGSLLVGAQRAGVIESVTLFFVAGRHAEAFVSAATEPGRELGHWVIREGLRLLRQRGVRTVNLGGGVQPHDGVYRYKQWWGWQALPLKGLCQVYDADRYDRLCREAGVVIDDDYFPAYRRRVP